MGDNDGLKDDVHRNEDNDDHDDGDGRNDNDNRGGGIRDEATKVVPVVVMTTTILMNAILMNAGRSRDKLTEISDASGDKDEQATGRRREKDERGASRGV